MSTSLKDKEIEEIKNLEENEKLFINYVRNFDEKKLQSVFVFVIRKKYTRLFSAMITKYPNLIHTETSSIIGNTNQPVFYLLFENETFDFKARYILNYFVQYLDDVNAFKSAENDLLESIEKIYFSQSESNKAGIQNTYEKVLVKFKGFAKAESLYNYYLHFALSETGLLKAWERAKMPVKGDENSVNILNSLVEIHLKNLKKIPRTDMDKVFLSKDLWSKIQSLLYNNSVNDLFLSGNIKKTATPLQNVLQPVFALTDVQTVQKIVMYLLNQNSGNILVMTSDADDKTPLRKLVELYMAFIDNEEIRSKIYETIEKILGSREVIFVEKKNSKSSKSAWNIAKKEFELKKFFLLIPGVGDDYFKNMETFNFYDLGWDIKLFQKNILEKAPLHLKYIDIAKSLIKLHNNEYLKITVSYLTRNELGHMLKLAMRTDNNEGIRIIKDRIIEKNNFKLEAPL